MMTSIEQIKLLRLIKREGLVTPGAEAEVGAVGPAFDRVFSVVIGRKLVVANGAGWQLTGDGEAIVDFADHLAGKAGA